MAANVGVIEQSAIENELDARKHFIEENHTSPMTPGGLADLLRKHYPDGHPSFIPFVLDNIKLHSAKNRGYAGEGPPLGNFERVARIMELYPNFPVNTKLGMLMMYYMKHFDNVMWGLCRLRPLEELKESYGDMSVYDNIARCMIEDDANPF